MPYDAETVGCTRHDSRPPNSPIDSPKSSSQKSCRQSVPSKVISVFPLTKERSSDVVFESSPTNSDISLQNQDLIQTSMNRESLTTLNDNLESNQAEEFSKGIFSEILKRLDQLKTSLSGLSFDVSNELTTLGSPNVLQFSERFSHTLMQLGHVQGAVLDQSRSRDLWMISAMPESPVTDLASPVRTKEISDKMDDLLTRLREATALNIDTSRCTASHSFRAADDNLHVRGKSWENDMEKKVLDSLSVVTDSIHAERASQLEAEVLDLRAQLAGQSVFVLPTSRIPTEREAAILFEEARVKRRWLETMQKGSWFFRVARKFGPLGKALKTLQRRRVFVRLSPDFRFVSLTSSEPAKQEIAKSQKATVIPLDTVEVFEYGSRSRAFRLLEEARSDTEHPAHLCMSCSTSKLMVDLVALNDADIERWVLGLNCLIPFFPGRQFFTAVEFGQEKTALRQEFFRKMDTKQRLPTSSSSKKIERETDRS